MSDPNLIKRGNATTGKVWNSVSSSAGDVMQKAATMTPGSEAGTTYRRVASMMKPSAGGSSDTGSSITRAGDAYGGGALKRREKDAGL